MVLDCLARRPIIPADAGDTPGPDDTDKFQRRLNELLVQHSLSPLTTWELTDDPMDAMRCVDGRLLE